MNGNKYVGFSERDSWRDGSTEVVIFTRLVGDPIAKLASDFAERWGMVAAIPDGEDSHGRQRVRLATVEEVTTRACDTAASLYAEFERRGWLVAIPDPKAPAAKKETTSVDG